MEVENPVTHNKAPDSDKWHYHWDVLSLYMNAWSRDPRVTQLDCGMERNKHHCGKPFRVCVLQQLALLTINNKDGINMSHRNLFSHFVHAIPNSKITSFDNIHICLPNLFFFSQGPVKLLFSPW